MQPEFGIWVREARQRIPMAQQHLADAAGLSVRTLGRIENGRPVAADTVQALRSVLDAALRGRDVPPPAQAQPVPAQPTTMPRTYIPPATRVVYQEPPKEIAPARMVAKNVGLLVAAMVAAVLLGPLMDLRGEGRLFEVAEAKRMSQGMDLGSSTAQLSQWRQGLIGAALATSGSGTGQPLVRTLSYGTTHVRPMGAALMVPGWDNEGDRNNGMSAWWLSRALGFAAKAPSSTVTAVERADLAAYDPYAQAMAVYSRATAGGWAWQERDAPSRPDVASTDLRSAPDVIRMAYGPTDTATCKRAVATTAALYPGRISFAETDAQGSRMADAYTPPPPGWRQPYEADGCSTPSGSVMLHARVRSGANREITP